LREKVVREGGDELEKLGSFPRLGRGNVENMFYLGTLVIRKIKCVITSNSVAQKREEGLPVSAPHSFTHLDEIKFIQVLSFSF
jgi:hypothetical protein